MSALAYAVIGLTVAAVIGALIWLRVIGSLGRHQCDHERRRP